MLSPAGCTQKSRAPVRSCQALSSAAGRQRHAHMTRVIAYIDGFNLYFGLKSKSWKRLYWLSPGRLAGNLLKPDQVLVATKYFTSRISPTPRDPDKPKRQTTWLEAVELEAGTVIHYGHYLGKTVTCRSCGASWSSPEEKMTDVKIAIELLKDAYEDAFDVAIIVSGDSDLAPAIQAVRAGRPGKRLIVASPPDRESKKLESVATASFRIGRKKLVDSQLPDEVVKPDGFILRRPTKWN